MAYNGSGTFLRIMNWEADAAAGVKIRADRHDQEDDNFASGLSNALTKDGQTQPVANIPMNGKKIVNLGTPTAATDAATKAYIDSVRVFTTGIDVVGDIIFKDGAITRGAIKPTIGAGNPAKMTFEVYDAGGVLQESMTLEADGLHTGKLFTDEVLIEHTAPMLRLIDTDTGAESRFNGSSVNGALTIECDIASVGAAPKINFNVKGAQRIGLSDTQLLMADTVGLSFGTSVAANAQDLSKHITLHSGGYGFNVTASTLNYNSGGAKHDFWAGATGLGSFDLNGAATGVQALTTGRLRLSQSDDATETSTGHAIQIGPSSGTNLRIDTNEILTVNNGVAGGGLTIQNGLSLGVPLTVADGGTGSTTAAAALTALGAAPITTDILAGNGLTGGGAISADRTLTLGTPGSIGNSSTNSVSTTSHTHAFDAVYAEVYTATTQDNLAFPLGHAVLVADATTTNRNSTRSIRLDTANTTTYLHTGTGGILTGVWRNRGGWTQSTQRVEKFQRTA